MGRKYLTDRQIEKVAGSATRAALRVISRADDTGVLIPESPLGDTLEAHLFDVITSALHAERRIARETDKQNRR